MVFLSRFNFLFFFLFSAFCFGSAISPSLKMQIKDAALRSHLDPRLVEAIIEVESNFATRATSHKGAMGLMQVMPNTADRNDIHQPYHSLNNLMGACDYLRSLINRFRGNIRLALAAYNAGPEAVERYKGIPPYPETQNYIKKIYTLWKK